MRLRHKLRRLPGRAVWWALIKLGRLWSSRYMDQFETVKFDGKFGKVYLTISRSSPWPDSFEPIDHNGRFLPMEPPKE